MKFGTRIRIDPTHMHTCAKLLGGFLATSCYNPMERGRQRLLQIFVHIEF